MIARFNSTEGDDLYFLDVYEVQEGFLTISIDEPDSDNFLQVHLDKKDVEDLILQLGEKLKQF